MSTNFKKYIVYIGDFDLRNENVQSFLVINNGKIFNDLGIGVKYIGINTKTISFEEIRKLPNIQIGVGNDYLELPSTLSLSGIRLIKKISAEIVLRLNEVLSHGELYGIITYQSPSYAIVLKDIALFAKRNRIPYIVNCADLPTFTLQPLYRRIVMKMNWNYMHYVNKKYSKGVIAVTKYIERFYKSENNKSVVIPPLFMRTGKAQMSLSGNVIPTFVYAGIPFKATGKEANPKGMKDRLDKVIDLFELLEDYADYKFFVLGIERDDYLKGVPRHNKFLATCRKIQFLGRKTHTETMKYVAEADFTINYRDKNLMTQAGFSTKIVESISLGTPVVINDISDTFDYLHNGSTGFMLTGNAEKDRNLIRMLCLLPVEKRTDLKRSTYIENPFEYSNYLTKVDTFLKSIDLNEDKT